MNAWSPQQLEVFKWFEFGIGTNMIAQSVAGSGKTTTLMSGVTCSPEARGQGTVLVAAFNKRIADELQKRITSPYVEAKTLHALGFGFVRMYWPKVQLDEDRGRRLAKLVIEDLRDGGADTISIRGVAKLADMGKQILIEPKSADDLAGLIGAFDIPVGLIGEELMCEAAFKVMELALQHDGTIDYTDMIYVPLRNKWLQPKYSLVCIDEAQDMNEAQIRLAIGVKRKGGRIAVFGDDRQAIYAFRGAAPGILGRLKRELWAVELNLTVSFRCPASVVERAKRLVPQIEPAPNAPKGEVKLGVSIDDVVKEARVGDFILSRTNAPLAKFCFKLLRARKKAKIEGRDIGAGLEAIVDRLHANDIPDLLKKLSEWEKKRVEKALAEDNPIKLVQIQDQAETIRVLSEEVDSIRDLKTEMWKLFGDDKDGPRIICSTIHKAKGLEADRVWLLEGSLYPWYGAEKDISERNIEYVGITRSKQTLFLVSGGEQLWKVRMDLGHTPACSPSNPADPRKGAWNCPPNCTRYGVGVKAIGWEDKETDTTLLVNDDSADAEFLNEEARIFDRDRGHQ